LGGDLLSRSRFLSGEDLPLSGEALRFSGDDLRFFTGEDLRLSGEALRFSGEDLRLSRSLRSRLVLLSLDLHHHQTMDTLAVSGDLL